MEWNGMKWSGVKKCWSRVEWSGVIGGVKWNEEELSGKWHGVK